MDASTESTKRVAAFLDTIAACEGTASMVDSGYRTLFGGGTFDDYTTHPDKRIPFRQTDGTMNYSTAAGRYQILHRTWAPLSVKLGLSDFTPHTQDLMAIELLAECGALPFIKDGKLADAVEHAGTIWASLPSSHYPQPRRSYAFVEGVYEAAGGTLA
jgi:muramidase (phage lysozyme)